MNNPLLIIAILKKTEGKAIYTYFEKEYWKNKMEKRVAQIFIIVNRLQFKFIVFVFK